MKVYWLRFLLLATFVFWATGAAKYTHELIEHHGRDASVDYGDDDDSSVAAIPSSHPASQDPSHHPAKHPCPVCQMLAGMMVERSSPPTVPPSHLALIKTLVIGDLVAPIVPTSFEKSARGPPVGL